MCNVCALCVYIYGSKCAGALLGMCCVSLFLQNYLKMITVGKSMCGCVGVYIHFGHNNGAMPYMALICSANNCTQHMLNVRSSQMSNEI